MIEHNLSKVAKALKKRHDGFVPDFSKDEKAIKDKLPKVMVAPYFDLRGDKIEVMNNTPLCTGCMIFLNGRCSLAHIVYADDASDPDYTDGIPHRREPLPRRLWGAHPEFIRRWITKKFIKKGMI
jgi:hypothetical protein